MRTYPIYHIDNEALIALIAPIKDKFRISIQGIADSHNLDVTLRPARPLDEDLVFTIRLNPGPGEAASPPFSEVDILGTILCQILSAGASGGDFTSWCKYFNSKPSDKTEKAIYAKVVEIDTFIRSILGDDEIERLIEESKVKGIV